MNYLKKVAATVALATATLSVPATAAELVTNGGFETGTFAGWVQGGNLGSTGVNGPSANTGNFGAFLGPVGSIGTLTQVLNTVVGTDYDISFDLLQNGGRPSLFKVFFDGTEIYSTTSGTQPSTYTSFNGFTETATSSLTTLLIQFRQDPNFYFLDNVSVQGLAGAVPEPGSWALMIVGFGAVGSAMRSRSRRRSTKVSFA
jgi:PEP-CTERM motif